jgi:hypothetical protein
MDDKSWYYAEDGEAVGPFFRDELAGKLPELQGPETLVHGPGLSDWRVAGEVPELRLAPPEPSTKPLAVLWLVYLFFRPRMFFQNFVIESAPGLTALCAWIYGVSGALDWIESRLMPEIAPGLGDSWRAYWTLALVLGVVQGAFFFAIGGWWYRVRLEWSGASNPDRALARRVYLFASQVLAIPWIAMTACDTATYDNPGAAVAAAGGWWAAVAIVFPVWSCWNSYVGVRTAFVVRRGAARLWFFILPCAFYAVFVIGVAAVLIVGLLPGPADVEHPQLHESAGLRFSYPGNWFVDDFAEDYDPDASVTVEPFSDAYARILVYESEKPPQEELEATLADFCGSFDLCREEETLANWGTYEGFGRAVASELGGTRYRLRVFVGELPDGRLLETHECYAAELADDVVPGFGLIRATCRVRK